ncbi:hypothetical protein ASPWEDRAFT_118414 [Aspergillus wentii DTO 134E9]|uniref:Hydrophobin n=1 Tax=Aspergillus wentii DTO 134E9 TaxID=1073089 RepID=A0A1L9R963_ASPWE|nr:uncharacterized protein ASPWEDRAFT_118414 [Aspergillus wentii DTO 134E9]KAI9926500.1 hypothetical protein MW887_004265 [Aspergillus wentii]OJJ31460.1 hypothetical protein ASPWEDRAFT_118414 [Aspergillus wentii DTO 134E9]
MKFSIFSTLAIVGATMVSAVPHEKRVDQSALKQQVESAAKSSPASSITQTEVTEVDCIKPLLCCDGLTTPLDGIVDGVLAALDINGAAIVGSIGLLCHAYDDSCPSAPQCCTEANILGGTLALGCQALKQ